MSGINVEGLRPFLLPIILQSNPAWAQKPCPPYWTCELPRSWWVLRLRSGEPCRTM